MKKFFNASGLWYLPEEPENRLTGIINFSADGLILTLSGQFQEGWSPDVVRYPLLYGVIDKSPYGEFVTLLEGLVTSQSFNSVGIGSETVRCRSAFIGNDQVTEKDFMANSIDITTTYLTDWIEEKNLFDWKLEKDEIVVSCERPSPVRLAIEGAEVIVTFNVRSTSGRQRASLLYQGHLITTPTSSQDANEMTRRYCQPFLNLLSFATDTPNAFDSILARYGSLLVGDTQVQNKIYYIFDSIFRVEKKKDLLRPEDMVFSFPEAQAAGVNIFQKWLEFCSKYEKFCTVYFATLYAQPRYLDEKFQRLISALSLLHPPDFEATPTAKFVLDEINRVLASRFDANERTLFSFIIPSGPEFQMPAQLYAWLIDYGDLMRQIVGDDIAGFVQSVVDTINYTRRLLSSEDEKPFQGGELHYAMQKIRTLIKIVVLKELGFDDAYVKLFIERNTYFQHMKSMIQQGGGA